MVRLVAFTSHNGDPVYVNPELVVMVTHCYSSGNMIKGSQIFQDGSERPVTVAESPVLVVARLELPKD